MGLFGKSFEETVAEAAQKIQGMGLGVSNFSATANGKVVTLTGEAPSVEVKGRAMQEFNTLVETENTMNQIKVLRPEPAPVATPMQAAVVAAVVGAAPAPATTAPAETWHEVVKGETLSAISKKYYGSANKYPRIFEANRDQLKDPDHIQIGQRLRIPQ